MTLQSTVRDLLARNGAMHPQYGGGLSNHVSMVVLALSGLDATDGQIAAYAEGALARLQPLAVPDEPVDAANWTARLGHAEAYRGYLRFFRGEISAHGRADTLAGFLPALLPGMAAAGFHCMLRTSYAVRFGEDEELSRGLAYWASHYRDLQLPEPQTTTHRSPLELWAEVRGLESLAARPSSADLIIDSLCEVARRPGFDRVADKANGDEEALARLAEAALTVYAVTRSFTALHMVTATHAWRVLEPFLSDRSVGRGRLWQGLTAAYVSIGAPEISIPAMVDPPSWEEILDRVRASRNEHVIKLVDTCRDEQSIYGDRRYQQVAAGIARK